MTTEGIKIIFESDGSFGAVWQIGDATIVGVGNTMSETIQSLHDGYASFAESSDLSLSSPASALSLSSNPRSYSFVSSLSSLHDTHAHHA